MASSVNTVTVSSTATLIIAANANRQELIITNNSVSTDIFIGIDSSVTSSTGLPLYANQSREKSRGFGTWLGPVYGITASSTADIRIWETER